MKINKKFSVECFNCEEARKYVMAHDQNGILITILKNFCNEK